MSRKIMTIQGTLIQFSSVFVNNRMLLSEQIDETKENSLIYVLNKYIIRDLVTLQILVKDHSISLLCT